MTTSGPLIDRLVDLFISVKARHLGDVARRPCQFGLRMDLDAISRSASSGWFAAPASLAPRYQLDFGTVSITLDTDSIAKLKQTRSPLKISLLVRSGTPPMSVGFVVVDGRSILSALKQSIPSEWFRVQSVRSKGTTPELFVECKSIWRSDSMRESNTVSAPIVYSPFQHDSLVIAKSQSDSGPLLTKPVSVVDEQQSDCAALPSEPVAVVAKSQSNSGPSPTKPVTAVDKSPPESTPFRTEQVPDENFRVSIDIRSIKDFDVALLAGGDVFHVRYSYSLFGDSTPVIMHTPIKVQEGQKEFLFHNSFCAFQFTMGRTEMEYSLSQEPLTFQVMQRSKDDGNDTCVGLATFDFSSLLTAHYQTTEVGTVRAVDTYLPVLVSLTDPDFDSDYDVQKFSLVAAIRVRLFLEELSKSDIPNVPAIDIVPEDDLTVPEEGDRGSLTYHVAWQLEMWKRQEMESFEAHMRQLQEERMEELERQWATSIENQQATLSRRQKDITALEVTLEQALIEVRQHESVLTEREADIGKLRATLKKDHDVRLQEDAVLLASQRRQNEQEISLRDKSIRNLKERISDLEQAYSQQTKDFLAFKQKAADSCPGKLQSELNDATSQITALKNQISLLSAKESRQQTQLVACLRELGRIKQTSQLHESERMERERLDLERLRIQMIAKQHERDLNDDRGQLQSIRSEIRRILTDQDTTDTPQEGLPWRSL